MKKKIFFLINSLEIGGSERVILELYNRLSNKYDVKLITLKNVTNYDSKIKTISLSKVTKTSRMLVHISSYVKKLKKIITEEKPDVLVSFLELSNLVNIFACKNTKTKCVISVRSTLSEVYDRGIYGKTFTYLIKKFYPKADIIITNSKYSKIDLVKSFNIPEKKISTVYNPLNIENVQKSSIEKIERKYASIFDGKSKILITVGRLIDAKAHPNLLRVFYNLKKEVKNVKLVIVGDGPWMQKLKDIIKELELESDVFLLGSQKNPYKYVKKSDIFVYSSVYEGFPNALIEGMACGVPVISTDCRSGPREILAPETNVLTQAKKLEFVKYGLLSPVFKKELNTDIHASLSKEEEIFMSGIKTLLNSKKLSKSYAIKGELRIKDFNSENMAKNFLKTIKVN
jgi:glycosyltransferase involved in cell wall biosynthesis